MSTRYVCCTRSRVDALTLACMYSRASAGGGTRQIDTFLGVLYLVQDYKVYGYVTNTGVRFILVVDDSDNKDGRYSLIIWDAWDDLFFLCSALACVQDTSVS